LKDEVLTMDMDLAGKNGWSTSTWDFEEGRYRADEAENRHVGLVYLKVK